MDELDMRIQNQSETMSKHRADIERLANEDVWQQFTHQFEFSSFVNGVREIQLQQTLT